jgi:prepilin-type N-terminal cleavage/methylation domain-containing protein
MHIKLRLPRPLGFTLIELMVVISLMVMILLTVTSLFFTSLIASTKTSTLSQLKEEGDFAQGQMEFLLRNAIKLLPNSSGQTCTTGMEEIKFQALNGGITTLLKEEAADGKDRIASNSGVYLTSANSDLISGPQFDCTRAADGSSTFVTITFTLRKGTPGVDQVRDIVTQDFQSGVALRSNN